jgi:hypothetical protein
MKKITLVLSLVLITLPLLSKAQGEFDPSYIISDYDLLNFNSMSLNEIQKFLESKNSFLATHRTMSSYGQEKSAAEIIYEAATHNYDCSGVTLSENPTEEERMEKCTVIGTVSPKFLLVLLQKEQSLVESSSPSQRALDWATGYGCPDSWACNPYFQGFGKQINSAALQFRWYMLNPQQYNFKVGETYTFSNRLGTISNEPMEVTIENKATAALYNYTPHVYNGNYNFWRIWNRYFPSQGYPEGTLLYVDDQYWLIENGERRLFENMGALVSRTDPRKALSIDRSGLSAYSEGVPIRFPNFSILMSPDGRLYLLVDDKKRLFSSTESFRRLGFNTEEIMQAAWRDINSYKNGKEITIISAYPTGALLQNKNTGGIYWVEEGSKAPILDKVFLKTKFAGREIIGVDPEELNSYYTVPPVIFPSGELLKSAESPAVYLIDGKDKRAFSSGEIFEELGYQWSNIITVPERILSLYPDGDLIE